MKLEHGIGNNDPPWFSEFLIRAHALGKPDFLYQIFKKREKTKNNAQFRRKRLPKGILPCISRFNSICLHKTLVHIISIDKWNQGVYPPVKIGIIWLQTNIR